ncbi:class I SAM-dependent DNA methyltransferase [Xenorhabdus sp. Sc-CR9]|uniref:class I SAM-dependent DNA methyltransferase n=1 Tax=Xenorhabdus sp. Sc-CR9 TaxID=2584468 RepID=UPI001F350F32|nr:class I SAM-dependent methyltransferase [Xenorhabdus sp. Sc-CR9]
MQEEIHYDHIGENYENFYNSVPQRKVEVRALFNMVGDVQGKSVLDLACGYGYFGRELYHLGASRVVGIDISEKMIELAREKSKLYEDKIEFHVANVSDMQLFEKFDIVTATFLFHYAKSIEELESMFRSVANHLKPSGRLIAYMASPDYQLTKGNCHNYGLNVLTEEPLQGGFIHQVEFITTPPIQLTFYRWSRETYANAIHKAGFSQLEWIKPILLESDIESYPPSFWDNYQKNCMHAGLICQLP